jgi:hypothetical protein
MVERVRNTVTGRIASAEPGPFSALCIECLNAFETWKPPICLLAAPSGALIYLPELFRSLRPGRGESGRERNE